MANIGRDLLGVLFTFSICSAIHFKVNTLFQNPAFNICFAHLSPINRPHLQMIVAEYSNYIDPIMSMVYIISLIWTCVPLVR